MAVEVDHHKMCIEDCTYLFLAFSFVVTVLLYAVCILSVRVTSNKPTSFNLLWMAHALAWHGGSVFKSFCRSPYLIMRSCRPKGYQSDIINVPYSIA